MGKTVKDIAKMAGVSTATVSNVLTHKRYVSTELESRVQKAIETLGYRPNTYARSLKTNCSYTIGVQVPDITNPFFASAVKVIQAAAIANGYQIILYDSDNDIRTEKQNLENMMGRHVDGIINIAPRIEPKALLTLVEPPLVVVDRPQIDSETNVAFVYSDNYKGAKAVADYVAEIEYQRYICLAGPVGVVQNARLRVDGFVETLKERSIQEDAVSVYYGDFTFASGLELMRVALDEHMDDVGRMVAFVTSDIMAWGAMEAVKERGLKLPRDVAMVGYDNIYFASYLYPALTTVQNPIEEMAESAANLMIDALEKGKQLKNVTVLHRSSLIVRNST